MEYCAGKNMGCLVRNVGFVFGTYLLLLAANFFMYIMYVDESGDPGMGDYNSPHYILSGLIVSCGDWQKYLDRLKTFRKQIKIKYKINQDVEIHANELIRINKNKVYAQISKSDRIGLLKEYCSEIPYIFEDARVINICFDKNEYDGLESVQVVAWQRMAEQFDLFLKSIANDIGIIISDDTDGKKIMQKLRQIKFYNPVLIDNKVSNAATTNIIEDLFQRSSHHSYFIQSVDVIAHLLYRREYPKGSLKKFRLEYQFENLDPILLKMNSVNDKFGIIRH